MKTHKILILGTLPPPIGGVTIHLLRFLKILDEKFDGDIYFWDYRRGSYKDFFLLFIQAKIVHLHLSNSLLRLLFTFFSFLLKKRAILTFHGKLGSRNHIGNICDFFALKLCSIPILLNDSSLELARTKNQNSILIPAFLPPQEKGFLNEGIRKLLKKIKFEYEFLFTTNTFDLVYDTDGREVYGISDLVELFSSFPRYCLLISDPKGSNYKMILKHKASIPQNVKFLPLPHPYFEILKHSDVMIRNTTKDGDSLSVKEALFLGKSVLATDTVSRHPLVRTYHDIEELRKILHQKEFLFKYPHPADLSGEEKLLFLYREEMKSQK
ncbi:MAG: hypothetical protein ACI4P6_05895 [Candidatus Spyradosoma sp.]